MKLKNFIHRHGIILTDKELSLCERAVCIMHQSKDKLHNHHHILALLENLEHFMKTEEYQRIGSQIQWNVLLLSICWHDVWRTRQTTEGIWDYVWQSFWEGIGSASLFRKESRKIGLDPKTINGVFYAIRKHTSFQILPRHTWEAKILWDLDCMDMFSLKRFNQIRGRFFRKKYRRLLKFGTYLIKSYAETRITHKLYFSFFKLKSEKAREKFAKEIHKFISLLNKKSIQND